MNPSLCFTSRCRAGSQGSCSFLSPYQSHLGEQTVTWREEPLAGSSTRQARRGRRDFQAGPAAEGRLDSDFRPRSRVGRVTPMSHAAIPGVTPMSEESSFRHSGRASVGQSRGWLWIGPCWVASFLPSSPAPNPAMQLTVSVRHAGCSPAEPTAAAVAPPGDCS